MKLRNILCSIILGIGASTVIPGIGAPSAYSLEVNPEMPGMLEKLISEPKDVTTLTITGPVDASDLYFIGLNMLSLTELDMQNATIERFNGVSFEGRGSYPAATLPSGVFSGLPLKKFVFPRQEGFVIDDAAFMNTLLPALELPANVDSIGNGAFAGCNALTSIDMPNVRIGTSLFADCAELTEVNLNGVTVIPAGTFRNCPQLSVVNGSENVTSIGAQAFEGDTSLTDFAFGSKLTHLGESAFATTGISEINLFAAKGIDVIKPQTFADSNVTSIRFPENMTEVGDGAFFGSKDLSSIQLPSSVISLGDHAFAGSSASQIELSDNLTTIGDYAMAGMDNVSELVLPATTIYIGSHAMEGMTGLSKINAESLTHVPELGEDVWSGVDQPSVMLAVHHLYEDDFTSADQWKEFKIDSTNSSEAIVSDSVLSGVKGRFVGSVLEIASMSNDIESVRLFDTSGRVLVTVEPRNTTVGIETSDFPGNIFIVNITLDNNITATLKLARR